MKKNLERLAGITKKHYLCIAPCQGRGREFESRLPLTFWIKPIENFLNAQVAELVDAHVSGACAARRAGSSPVLGTVFI